MGKTKLGIMFFIFLSGVAVGVILTMSASAVDELIKIIRYFINKK